jgi:tetratricopeptide (TPR) repeat protein
VHPAIHIYICENNRIMEKSSRKKSLLLACAVAGGAAAFLVGFFWKIDWIIFLSILFIFSCISAYRRRRWKDSGNPFADCRAIAMDLQRWNRFKEAEDYCLRCLGLASSPEEKAEALNCLGTVRFSLKDYAQAVATYTEALQIYRELAGKNPEELSDVAMVLINIAIVYHDVPNKALSLQYANEAIEVLQQCHPTPDVKDLLKHTRKKITDWRN